MPTLGRRRALGQHFLKDTEVANAIAEEAIQEALRNSCETLLEIGPGRGAITYPLLARLSAASDIHKLILVEKDRRLVEFWKQEAQPKLQIVDGDFLDVPSDRWLGFGKTAIVSNLPYSSGTAILKKLAERFDRIPCMVLMFQAEVARKLRAEPETKQRGSLSVWIQNRWDVHKLLAVPPRSFSPPPDVDSEVVVLTRRDAPRIHFPSDPKAEAFWEKFLKTCFAQKRKMLRSVVPWRNALELSGVDGKKRAEALQWDEWNSLFQAVRAQELL